MSISDLTIRFAQVRIRDDTMEEMLKLLAQSTSFRALVEEQRKANRLKEEELELQRRQHQDARPLNLNPGQLCSTSCNVVTVDLIGVSSSRLQNMSPIIGKTNVTVINKITVPILPLRPSWLKG